MYSEDGVFRLPQASTVIGGRLVPGYASLMPVMSKTVEVGPPPHRSRPLSPVADFEAYPQWHEEVKGVWVLARYGAAGRPSQLRLDTEIQGATGTYMQAVYSPTTNQI